jgi:hypothetical protein
VVWTVLAHPSRSVAYEVDTGLLDQVATRLPVRCTVVVTADRGVADIHLRQPLTGWGWQGRMRLTGSVGIQRHGKRDGNGHRSRLSPGPARVWPHLYMTKQSDGPVPLARGRPPDRQEAWLSVSDEPTAATTCEDDGRRFDSEEHVLEDTSHGCQLEASLIRSAQAVERLCWVLAITTLSRVSQGTDGVNHGTRRGVDAHGLRGQSSVNLGWNWVKLALSREYELMTRWQVAAAADPAPAMASKLQHQKPPQLCCRMEFQDAVA